MSKNSGYNSLSDAELVAYLRNGDDNAFTEIYHRFQGILHVHAYKKLGDFEAAKEVIRAVFSMFWNKREDIPRTENISGYLYTMTKHKVLAVMAHKKIDSRHTASFATFINQGIFITELINQEKELTAIIEKEIEALPQKMRAVFMLSRQRNLSHREISQQLDIPERVVKCQVNTALKLLRVKLGLMAYLLVLVKF
jgi:RNA polymerase sigma factor (sigma-70 family)